MLLWKAFSANVRSSTRYFDRWQVEGPVSRGVGFSRTLLCFVTLLSLATAPTYARGFIAARTYPTGYGTFQAAQAYTANAPRSLGVGDFNGDGFLDIAAGSFGSVAVLISAP
jgi:FG-GAP repeat